MLGRALGVRDISRTERGGGARLWSCLIDWESVFFFQICVHRVHREGVSDQGCGLGRLVV